MGTSTSYGGPGGGTPLVPTWLESPTSPALNDPAGPTPPAGTSPPADAPPGGPARPEQPVSEESSVRSRFTDARSNFTRFARSGGSDRGSLGRAVSGHVSTSSGGASRAARRMGASRVAGGRLLNFLADARAGGTRDALRKLNLEALAGRPLEEIFLGLVDYVCPDGGSVDEGIARTAFIETVADLAGTGIADLDALTPDQMQTVFELYATRAIEARLCNDIGMNLVAVPSDIGAAMRVQSQLHDFILRGVSDALTSARATLEALTPDRVMRFVDGVYEAAFGVLDALGDAESRNV